MAFTIRNLSVLAYANGFTLWHYRTAADVLVRVEKPGFFAAAADMLTGGDIVMVSAMDGTRLLAVVPGSEVATARMC